MRVTVDMRRRSESHRARGLAERQFGAIARHQLLRIGFSDSRVDRWLREGRLHVRYPGVYALGRLDLSERGQLAAGLLYAGTGSALAGLTQLWWRSLLTRRPSLIHLDAPGRKGSRQDLWIRHPKPFERLWHRDLPVVPLPQALLTASDALNHDSLRLVLARAEYEGVLCLSSLQSAIEGRRRGSAALRTAMDTHLPQLARCANDFELLLRPPLRGLRHAHPGAEPAHGPVRARHALRRAHA